MRPQASNLVETHVSSLDEWQRLVSSVAGSLTMVDDEATFTGIVSSRQFGSTALVHLSTDQPHTVIRDPAPSEDATPQIAVSLQIRGHSFLEQHGRTARLNPGDFVIFNLLAPYRRTFPESSETFFIVIPMAAIAIPATSAAQLSAVKVDGSHGFGSVVSQFLTGVSSHLHEFSGAAGARTAQSVVDVVAATLMQDLDLIVDSRELQRRRLRSAVRAYIEAQYHDPLLTTESIAANFFVSARHLHNLFRDEGTTVAELLRLERLRVAYRLLNDENNAHLTVAQVASQCGYANATSFSRAYRAHYGSNPRGRAQAVE